jgi:hypothetical protein
MDRLAKTDKTQASKKETESRRNRDSEILVIKTVSKLKEKRKV